MLNLLNITLKDIEYSILQNISDEVDKLNGIRNNYTCYRTNHNNRADNSLVRGEKEQNIELCNFTEHNVKHIEEIKMLRTDSIDDLYEFVKTHKIREIEELTIRFSEDAVQNLIKSGKVFVKRGRIII